MWFHGIQYYMFLTALYHVYHYTFISFVHCTASKNKGDEHNVSETSSV